MGVQLAPARCFHNADDAAGFMVAHWPVGIQMSYTLSFGGQGLVLTAAPFYMGARSQDQNQPDTSTTAYVALSTNFTGSTKYIPVTVDSCGLVGVQDMTIVIWLIGAALLAVAGREFVRKSGVI